MPYKWVEPKLFLRHFGVNIYHTYKDNNIDKPEGYRFSTACHEDFEVHVYEFDVREFGAYEAEGPVIEDVIKWLIEHQTLKMPTRLGTDYPFKRGSFNWYLNHPNEAINRLAKAMSKADGTNKPKMYRALLHMGNAHQMQSWDSPYLKGHVIDAPREILFKGRTKLDDDETKSVVDRGSFFWYLHMSGGFVTHLANAIMYGDNNIVELIRTEYPQMVAAAEQDDWHKPPPGFNAVYDAPVTYG